MTDLAQGAASSSWLQRLRDAVKLGVRGLDSLQPVLDLGLRLWVAEAFFRSGLTKIQSWDSTLMLFEYEYSVPLLSPSIAAWMATAGELILPILLVIGLASRFSAAGLLIVNVVAVIAYPDISPAGIKDHYIWGTMLLVTLIHGPGRLSIDHYIRRRYWSS